MRPSVLSTIVLATAVELTLVHRNYLCNLDQTWHAGLKEPSYHLAISQQSWQQFPMQHLFG